MKFWAGRKGASVWNPLLIGLRQPSHQVYVLLHGLIFGLSFFGNPCVELGNGLEIKTPWSVATRIAVCGLLEQSVHIQQLLVGRSPGEFLGLCLGCLKVFWKGHDYFLKASSAMGQRGKCLAVIVCR